MPAIQELICESIDDKFAYAKYGEFKVMMMKDNGYINVTKLCKEGEKEFFHWKSLESSKKFLDSFSKGLNIPKSDLLIIINSGNTNVLTRGTYAHPDLVPHIASWVNHDFAIKVSKIVKDYFIRELYVERDRLRGERDSLTEMLAEEKRLAAEERKKAEDHRQRAEEALKKSDEERQRADEERKKSDEERKKSEERYANLCKQYNITSINLDVVNENLEVVMGKLDDVSSVVVPPSENKGVNESFCLLRRDKYDEATEYKYYVLCGQIKYVNSSKKIKIKSGMSEVISIKCTPNTKNLYHRIKDSLSGKISYRGNNIDLVDISELEFVRDISYINDEKLRMCQV